MPTTRPSVLTGLLAASLVVLAPACGSDGSSAGTGAGGGSPTGGSAGSSGSGSGGASGNGGTGGAGGTNGGTSGNGGSGGTGGTGGAAAGTGGSMSGTGGSSNPSGGFTLNVSLSTAIATVGILTFSLDGVESADVEFGRDQSALEYEAPVDVAAADHRTLLLGMKPDTTYYVRVTAKAGGKTVVSDVAQVKTGFLPNGLPVQSITDHDASALYAGGGFTTACTGFGGFGDTGGPRIAFIFDQDGDVVWAYDLASIAASACTRARMSYDGKYMWIGNFGNTSADGALSRFTMDGLGTVDDYSLPGRSHDFAILPNDHVVYFARTDGGGGQTPEAIYELDPATKMSTLIYDQMTDFEEQISERGGHTNHINYVPELNAVSFSMYFADTIALVSYPAGQLLAAFGGEKSTFSTMAWTGQHGHDIRADHANVFNNEGTNGGASVLRFTYDMAAKSATEEEDYSSGIDSPAFGDVKEQPNGNFFLTYSTSSVMQELDSSLTLLREIQTSVLIGYTEHRASLYGKPPPFDR